MSTSSSPSGPVEMLLAALPGIGPARARSLAAAGLHTLADLLHRPPRRIAAVGVAIDDGPLPKGVPVQLRAQVARVSLRRMGKRTALEVQLRRSGGQPALARFFNAPWLRSRFLPGEWYLFEGRSDARLAGTLNQPSFSHLTRGDADPTQARSGCDIAWELPEGWGAAAFAALVAAALARAEMVGDPAVLVDAPAWAAILRDLHAPASIEAFDAARRALARREALALAWLLARRRAEVTGAAGRAWRWDDHIQARALARLPFALTPGQAQALAEIRADLQRSAPMYRLLAGDVGSGKTALALLAALAVIAERAQVLILAPTAVLAAQHHAFCARCLAGSRVRLGLLTGGTPSAERAQLLADLEAGACDLLIGTHALIEDSVRCRDLGLAVIDEQHKFGVAQRAALLTRGQQDAHPDLLLMTATPIPRSLALSAWGDLALSRIEGLPPGRGRVVTELRAGEAWLDAALDRCLAAGGRAFVVCARREAQDEGPMAATTLAERLRTRWGADRVALIHGRLDEADKLAALAAFRDGAAQVLVATTVVEVGVDVAAADLMAVLNAERFGLAQLHQLRGRVGRGGRDGLCILGCGERSARTRLEVLVEQADGLAIAEADLATRGPGEFLGTRQAGLPRLRRLELPADLALLSEAHAQVAVDLAAGRREPPALAALLDGPATQAGVAG